MPSQPHVVSGDQSGGELDYVRLLRGVVRRRKIIVAAAFALIALPLLGWTMYGQRPRYQSAGRIHIKRSIAETLPGTRDLPVGPDLSVQMAVLESRSLATEVLDAVPQETLDELMRETLDENLFLTLSNEARRLLGKPPVIVSPRDHALAELRRGRMSFRPAGRGGREPSGLVDITATAFKPRVAMDLVHAYIQVLVNWSRRSEQEDVTATQKFLELQLGRVERDLKDAEAGLMAFEERHGVVKLTDQTQFEMSRLVQLQGELAQVRANQEVAQTSLKALERALKKSPDASPVSSGEDITAEAAQSIHARLTQLEATLVQMRAKYTDQHPALIAARDEIHNLRSQLAQLPMGGARADKVPMGRDEILRNMATHQANLAKFRADEQSLKLQVDQFRKSLQRLSGQESEYSRLRGSVGSNRALLAVLSDKHFALRIREQGAWGVVKIIDPPTLPTGPVSPVNLRKLAFLVVFAFGGAVGLGFLVEYIYEPVDSEGTIRRQVSLPFLGTALAVPWHRPKAKGHPRFPPWGGLSRQPRQNSRPLVVFNESRKAAMPQEFYRTIRTNFEAVNRRSPFKAVMISSACPEEGKSTTAINLAITLRELGRRVALVDADLRYPSLSKVFRPRTSGGLTHLLDETRYADNSAPSLEIALDAMAATGEPDFLFIPSGARPEDPAALLGSSRAREFVAFLRRRWDYVIFDSPPVLLVSDNLLLAKSLDGVILVAQAGRTRRRDLHRAKDILEEAGARILGVILNDVPPSHIPYYHHRYRSYYAPDAADQTENQANS
jgi:polysaccharide biosynthesis transport protein